MKNKSLLLLSSLLIIGGITSCGNSPADKGDFRLNVIGSDTRRWSQRSDGFFFGFDESTRLGSHKATNIKFHAKENVDVKQIAGEGEDYLTYKWQAICMDVGSFTLSATIDDLISNTLTFTVKEKETFNMECNITNGTKLNYNYKPVSGSDVQYTVTKLDNSYMLCSYIPFEYDLRPEKFYKKQESGKLLEYNWNIDQNEWAVTGKLLDESAALSSMLLMLYPDPIIRDMEFTSKKDGSHEIKVDGQRVEVPVVMLEYRRFSDSSYREYLYYSQNGLSLPISANEKSKKTYDTTTECHVMEMDTTTVHPFAPPEN